MKKMLGVLAAALLYMPFAGAQDSYDVQYMNCQELLSMDEETATIVILWLDGYLSGLTGDTAFTPEGMGYFAESVGMACGRNPGGNVLSIARSVGLE